jgi:SAM-dependent methyltransferase
MGVMSLWAEGMHCGASGLLASRSTYLRRQSIRLLCCPVDLWRYLEFPPVLKALEPNARVLDVGSPKILARILAKNGAQVTATDIADTVHEECRLYSHGLPEASLTADQVDATALPYDDNTFSLAYAVSVLEHIGEHGDTHAIREMARVVRPGGRVVVTVPIDPVAHETWAEHDNYGEQHKDDSGRVFFSRYYDNESLRSRIIEPSRLQLENQELWQERSAGWYADYVRRVNRPTSPAALATKLLDPLWAHLRIETVASDSRATRHGVAALTLKKSGG